MGAIDPIHQQIQAGHVDTCEADAAKKPQNQRDKKAVCEHREREAASRPEQCANHIDPSTVDAIGGTRQEWNRYGVPGEIDAPDPTRLARVECPIGGDLVQSRREGHLGGEVGHQAE